ncbi:hypothetical protein BV20DRAFT_575098 [Pilatotrama ljubarskyi]|nr:hypothetical protein BV20DRAFT_575098 [Pilatotrama ljubarskyi]
MPSTWWHIRDSTWRLVFQQSIMRNALYIGKTRSIRMRETVQFSMRSARQSRRRRAPIVSSDENAPQSDPRRTSAAAPLPHPPAQPPHLPVPALNPPNAQMAAAAQGRARSGGSRRVLGGLVVNGSAASLSPVHLRNPVLPTAVPPNPEVDEVTNGLSGLHLEQREGDAMDTTPN